MKTHFTIALAAMLFLAGKGTTSRAETICAKFTVAGFPVSNGHAAPTDPVSGTIVWTAADVHSDVQSFVSIDLTLDGHTYSVSELGFWRLASPPTSVTIGGTLGGGAVSSGSDDFWISWDSGSLTPLSFAYASSKRSGIWEVTTAYNPTCFQSFSVSPITPPGNVQCRPTTQTAESNTTVKLLARASGTEPLWYQWYLSDTNLVGSGTNSMLQLTNVQTAQSGLYTVMVTNYAGMATSAPAALNVIAPVDRRPVPGLNLTGQSNSVMDVYCTGSLSPVPDWATLASVSLSNTSQFYFDLTLPLPSQRFYRARQSQGVPPVLDVHLVSALTLTGAPGSSVRVDAINRFGPIDAWFTLATATLTNTPQLFFDVSAVGQPERLYRLVPLP